MKQSAFAATMKAQLEQQPPQLSPDQAELYGRMLESTIEGDRAEVRLPGLDVPFRLRKEADRWWIVSFP
jgi:hypothetical protein